MEKRQLGLTPLRVTPWALGTNMFGGSTKRSVALRVLDAYVDAGGDVIDTADIYGACPPSGRGESESVVGEWMRSRRCRASVAIATKVGMEMAPGQEGLSRRRIVQSVEDSLRRLQTDYIDLYQSHQDDRRTPLEETLGAYTELI